MNFRLSRCLTAVLLVTSTSPAFSQRIFFNRAEISASEPRLEAPVVLFLRQTSTCSSAPLSELSLEFDEEIDGQTQRIDVTLHNPNPMNTIQCDDFSSQDLALTIGRVQRNRITATLTLTGVAQTAGNDLVELIPFEAANETLVLEQLGPTSVLSGNYLEPFTTTVVGCTPTIEASPSVIVVDASCNSAEEPLQRLISFPILDFGNQSVAIISGDESLNLQRAAALRTVPADITGAWFDPEASGHGFLFQLLHPRELLAYWFVYDPAGNQVWLYGSLNSPFFPFFEHKVTPAPPPTNNFVGTLYRTSGGGFPPQFDPSSVNLVEAGTLSVTFQACGEADARWTPIEGDEIDINLSQLSRTWQSGCRQ